MSPVISKCNPAISLFDRNSSVQHHTALQIYKICFFVCYICY
nr:MAG TPA: hypothetical protein [Caudoviricetes sp.]